MVVAAQMPTTKPGSPRNEAAHLMGAAIGAKSNWEAPTTAVDDAVYGYHSASDNVLNYVYRVAQAGQSAAGLTGYTPSSEKLRNVDMSDAEGCPRPVDR
ncbi:DUF726 domain-containing protein [Microbacterium sp. 16-032]|uniref:DUF726 domain-containing protein n=1 Tax=Microbacterium sp. 16-032 TaxID=3239808 RepID=UPI0034E1D68B